MFVRALFARTVEMLDNITAVLLWLLDVEQFGCDTVSCRCLVTERGEAVQLLKGPKEWPAVAIGQGANCPVAEGQATCTTAPISCVTAVGMTIRLIAINTCLSGAQLEY
jgi:hypothetical protein